MGNHNFDAVKLPSSSSNAINSIKNLFKKIWNFFATRPVVLFILAFGLIGTVTFLFTIADSTSISIEPESSAIVSPITVGQDITASGGEYVQFGKEITTPPPESFQPSEPYYATFFYPWYKNKTTDGSYSYWHDAGNNPPKTWFSHYLPDIDPSTFDPEKELYSSNDYDTFKWQVAKMAEAKMEVSIASWFGQGSKQDSSIQKYLNDFMARPDNPYPNLRWALYYECEGITTAQSSSCPSNTANPTTSQIVNDLTHIKNTMATSPYFLEVEDKPVIFVYGNDEGTHTSQRWKDANAQLGNYFYIVLKVYSGYQNDPNQPDSWHQYAPANNYGSHGDHSAYVSPGFWLDTSGTEERLSRDIGRFNSDVSKLVNANTKWRLVQTWNEWGEGSSVEPGTLTQIDSNGNEIAASSNTFGNTYIESLANRLPDLENGTGLGLDSGQITKDFAQAEPNSSVLGTASYTFTAGGDSGIRPNADATLANLDQSGSDFHLMLGDLDYDDSYDGYDGANDADYCAYVKSRLPTLGPNFPFQIVSGNHEDQDGPDGYIMNHAQCLPDRLNSVGEYGEQYYFDYPTSNPNLRTIMLPADLEIENINYKYAKGSAEYIWLSDAIDDARSSGSGIKWIVVGMHKNCISVGEKQSCEVGRDLFNLLLEKRVDVIVQGHDHNYQRSKQLALNDNCPSIVTGGFDADCVVGSGDNYTKGAGPVLLVNGVFGKCCYSVNPSDPEVGYFAKYIGSNISGMIKFTVTDDKIDGEFVSSTGTFTDTFSIAGATTPDTTIPSTNITSPSTGDTISGVVQVSANATDDSSGISKVEFLIDGKLANTDNSSPYNFSWDSTSEDDGQHTLQSVAYDSAGNKASSELVTINVLNGCKEPSNTIGSLSYNINVAIAGEYTAWARIKAPDTTNDSIYITGGSSCASVLGNNTGTTPDQWIWVSTYDNTENNVNLDLETGDNSVIINGRDQGVKLDRILLLLDSCIPVDLGNNCVSTADETKPIVDITSPEEGASVSGVIELTAESSDPESGVTKVEFFIDNQLVSIDTSSPYSTNLDTSEFSPGAHTLKTIAQNGEGLTEVAQVSFTIIDVIGPSVSVVEPQNLATISGNSKIVVNATDNKEVSRVEFYINDNLIETVVGTGPYSISWDTWQTTNGEHRIKAVAFDTSGNSNESDTVIVTVNNDYTPPSVPTGITLSANSSSSVDVSWSESTDNVGVEGYYLMRDGIVIKDLLGATNTSYTDNNLNSNTVYSYSVISYDVNRNQSQPSQPVTIQTPEVPVEDVIAPTVPRNLSATAVSISQINLEWEASTDEGSGLQEYRIYRDNTQIATSQTVTFGDTNLQPNTSYSYSVVAVDKAGNESDNSNLADAMTLADRTTTLSFVTTEDTFGYSKRRNANRNYGDKRTFEIDNSPQKQAFIKFNVSGLDDRIVKRAVLKLKVHDKSSNGGSFYGTSSDWSENSLNWNNKPQLGEFIGSIGNAPKGATVELDVTDFISSDGVYSIGINSTSSNGVDYYSREAGDADRPTLELILY